jgi:hypothetical protein
MREGNEDFWNEWYIERLGESMEKCRQTVMNYFNQCVTKYNKQLRAEFQSRYVPGDMVNERDDNGNKQLIDIAPRGQGD